MVADDKVIPFDQHTPINAGLSDKSQQALKVCREIILKGLPKSFTFFDSLDDTLFDLADKAENNQKQEEYFLAMRQIRLVQADIKKQFTQHIIEDFDNFWKKPTSKDYPHLKTNQQSGLEQTDELSLLQNADLEEDIAIKRIIARSQTLCGNEIGNLTRRFAHMLQRTNQSDIDNPLDSDDVIEHLKNVISPLPVSLPIKLVIYKQYEKQAVTNLLKLYQSLNKALIDNDILPKISYKTANTQQTPLINQNNRVSEQTTSVNLPLEQAVEQHLNQQQELSSDNDLFNNLRQLLSQQSTSRLTSRYNEYNSSVASEQLTSIADPQSLLNALSNIQQSQPQIAVSPQGQLQLPELRHNLIQTLNSTNQANGINQTLSPLDNDTLDIIDMLFEFVLEDKNIPVPMRALLARLQIPMLKIAIADKGFFQHKNHPARRLLNNLAQAATGWTQTKQYEQDPLYKFINEIVNQLIEEFDSDIRIFDHFTNELARFTQHQQHNLEAVEKLTAETSQGQERVEMAQHHVDKVIHDLYIENSPIPKVIVSLIEDGWKQSLRLRLIQKGEDSDEWLTSISLIKQLLHSVKPTNSDEERQQRLDLVPGLHKEVQQYLQATPITANTLAVLLKSLQRCHIKVIKGDPLLENELKHFDADSKPETETITPEQTQQTATEQLYSSAEAIEKVKRLRVGTWVDIQQPDQEPRRIKFSWRSNLTKRCLFVTSKGVKAAEWSEQELAAMFEKGEASILDQSKPLMDRALVSMMETINKTQ